MAEPQPVFCSVYRCPGRGRATRSFSGCTHRYHVDCMGNMSTGNKAACPRCLCATCLRPLSGRARLIRPCRCSVHDAFACRGGLAGLAECGRCGGQVESISEAMTDALIADEYAAVNAPPPTLSLQEEPTVAERQRGGSLLPTPEQMLAAPLRRGPVQTSVAALEPPKKTWSFFGFLEPRAPPPPERPTSEEIVRTMQLERFAGLKRLGASFAEVVSAGVLLRTIVEHDAKWDDLVHMGISKDLLLRTENFDVPALVKAGCTYANLTNDVAILWPELRPKRLSFTQLQSLKPTMYELCSSGFIFSDLLTYKEIPVASWAAEPFCLTRATWLLLPGQTYSLGLTPQRLEELRTRNGTKWSNESIRAALWPGQQVPTEFVQAFTVAILPT